MTIDLQRLQDLQDVQERWSAESPELTEPKVRRGIGKFIRCVRTGFTGSLDFDFKDGVPMGVRRTDCERFGKPTP